MRHHLLFGAAAAALVVPAASAYAQQITTGIEGTVRDEAGAPLPGATVTITDTRTGSTRTLTSSSSGSFRADNLVTGGPYSVQATADGYEGQTLEDIVLNLQGNVSLAFNLTTGSGDIIVTGARATVTQLAIGPGQSFGVEALESFPSITRDIRDIIRIDPRVSLDRSNEVDRISCLGGNDRSNTFTVDGILQADIVGLNGTPFAARNALPIPFDAVRETSVEFAPFDVQYGAFTGCAINVVTRSGQNEFHGSAFFNYTSDSLQGNRLGGQDLEFDFEEKRWGAALSGPIFKDRLFFSFAYEETDLGDVEDTGLIGSGFANTLPFATEAQFDRFAQIARDTYGVDPGPIARTLPESSVRYFGRIDWYITEGHRFEATYQRLEETNVEGDDFFSPTGDDYTGVNSYEDEGTEASFYSARLYSEWNDIFSTEIRMSRADVQDVQGPVGGGEAQSDNPLPRLVVGVNQGNENGSFIAGPGFSRAANDLRTQVDQIKVAAHIKPEGHDITIGAEVQSADVFNLFIQNATGTLVFANLDDFAAGRLTIGTNNNPNGTQIVNGGTTTGNNGALGAYINATPTGNVNTAAADYTRTLISIYAQDNWQVTPRLTVLGGLRLDWFDGNAPQANPTFLARYGFSNSVSFSNIPVVVQPRLGFTYNFENDGTLARTQLKGGVGIFSGGDPLVWVSNAFQNNGRAQGFGGLDSTQCAAFRAAGGGRGDVVNAAGTFTGVPQCIFAAAAAQAGPGLADTQSTDPNFKIPTVVRANIGFATEINLGGGFFDGWNLNLDYIYSNFRNPVAFTDLSQVVRTTSGLNGFTIDGRPIYAAIDPTVPGCTARFVGTGGTPPTFTGVNAPCFNTQRDDEIQVTNSAGFQNHSASLILSKNFRGGVFTPGGSVRFNLGYAYTDAEQRRFNNDATAGSSYDGGVLFDRQNPEVHRSSFASTHNLTMGLNFREQFFGDYDSSFGFVFVARSGRPYSIRFANNNGALIDSVSGTNATAYIISGVNDPNVVFTDTVQGGRIIQTAAQAAAGYDAFIAANECVNKFRGRSFAPNSCENDWFFDLDLRFAQELPGPGSLFGVDDRFQLFADFDNILNLIDSSWNVSKTRGNSVAPIDVTGVDAQGRYILNNFRDNLNAFPEQNNIIQTSSSLWRIQLGVRYSF